MPSGETSENDAPGERLKLFKCHQRLLRHRAKEAQQKAAQEARETGGTLRVIFVFVLSLLLVIGVGACDIMGRRIPDDLHLPPVWKGR